MLVRDCLRLWVRSVIESLVEEREHHEESSDSNLLLDASDRSLEDTARLSYCVSPVVVLLEFGPLH